MSSVWAGRLRAGAPSVGPLLRLDSDKEKFVHNPAADTLLTRDYRKPFLMPAEREV